MIRGFLAIAVLVAGAGCGGAVGDEKARAPVSESPQVARAPVPVASPSFAPYEPDADEPYRDAKRLAGRVVQRLTTYEAGVRPRDLAETVATESMDQDALAHVIAPLVPPGRRSAGQIVYPQLSGVTSTTLGTMVVFRQHLQDARGRGSTVSRVADVRLRRLGGRWALERIVSVGGSPVPRPTTLPSAAVRVLDHPRIELPDTARWDIHRGRIDESLLRALARSADRRAIAISVLRTGHPPNVWATTRPSAHASGFAADLYAADGKPIIRRRDSAATARRLATELLEAGATQVGSPFVLPPGGPRSFTDAVHQDHIHLQQTALG